MGPKASASQRKLGRENSVCKVTKTHSLQQSHPYHPLFSLFSYWKQMSRFGRVLIATRTQCATYPGIEPHCAHSQECGLFLFSHLPKNPQPTPWGRKQGQTTHGLTQHRFLYCCPEERDFTQAATLCIPKKWQKQSNIRNTTKGAFGQTRAQHQLPAGGF